MLNQEVTEIAQVIWESVLHLPLEPEGDTQETIVDERLTAAIGINGAWNGTVTLTLSAALGKRVAGAMLRTEPAQLAEGDVPEALLEVVNMLAGNLKALLPAPCALALPSILSSAETVPGKLDGVVRFSCLDQPVEIAVHSAQVAVVSGAGIVAC